ncbi:MAG: hypothetical protein IT158_12305 [Bryobacterales bacterium]|nr:hypothetical protein [Bryobacterales bacterium]
MRLAPVLAWVLAVCAFAQPSVDAVSGFARRLAGELRSSPATLAEVRSLAGQAVPAGFAQRFQTALSEAGVALSPGAAVAIRVTLSSNPEGPLWVAEIVEGDKRQAVLYAPPASLEPAAQRPPAAALSKELLIEGERPILDAVLSGGRLLVLEPGEVVSYTGEPGRWLREASAPVPAQPARDPRGKLEMLPDGFRVYLAGAVYEGRLEPALAVQRVESPAGWPVGSALARMPAGRNFFDGRLVEGGAERRFPPFYSAVPLLENGEPSWLVATTAGHLSLFEKGAEPAAEFAGWGSDIALLEGACEGRRLLLAARPGAGAEPDAVTAIELPGRQLVPASAPLELAGSITALWSWGKETLAVVRDAGAHRYAAYKVSAACGN